MLQVLNEMGLKFVKLAVDSGWEMNVPPVLLNPNCITAPSPKSPINTPTLASTSDKMMNSAHRPSSPPSPTNASAPNSSVTFAEIPIKVKQIYPSGIDEKVNTATLHPFQILCATHKEFEKDEVLRCLLL